MTRPGSASVQKRGADLTAMLPSLIQCDITIHCSGEESGNIYSARVLGVDKNLLRINLPHRIAGRGYLRSSRPVVLSFLMDNKLYTCTGQYRAENDHSRELLITGDIKPTTRRSFVRHPLKVQAVYVPVSEYSLVKGRFSKLRWKKSTTFDLSAGGTLLETTFQAPVKSHLLLNLEIPGFYGPFFIFGQVRWFDLNDVSRNLYLCGISFIPREELPRHFSRRAISELPSIMLSFDRKIQKELDAFLDKHTRHRSQGEENDN